MKFEHRAPLILDLKLMKGNNEKVFLVHSSFRHCKMAALAFE